MIAELTAVRANQKEKETSMTSFFGRHTPADRGHAPPSYVGARQLGQRAAGQRRKTKKDVTQREGFK